MIKCCFAGHGLAPHSLMQEIMLAVEDIIRESNVIEFYSGGMGDFDKLCEQAVRETKKRYTEKEIRLSLVLPSYQYAHENEYLEHMQS